MTEQELKELRHRCQYAHFHGFSIGKSDEIAAALVKEGASKPKAKVLSAGDLLKMVEEVLAKDNSKTPAEPEKAPAAPEPKPKKKGPTFEAGVSTPTAGAAPEFITLNTAAKAEPEKTEPKPEEKTAGQED